MVPLKVMVSVSTAPDGTDAYVSTFTSANAIGKPVWATTALIMYWVVGMLGPWTRN
ncbi:hypothetical protein D3C73_1572330 [compost metagenome]